MTFGFVDPRSFSSFSTFSSTCHCLYCASAIWSLFSSDSICLAFFLPSSAAVLPSVDVALMPSCISLKKPSVACLHASIAKGVPSPGSPLRKFCAPPAKFRLKETSAVAPSKSLTAFFAVKRLCPNSLEVVRSPAKEAVASENGAVGNNSSKSKEVAS